MIIGYDAKRAFRNNTGLGNYSRMLITQSTVGTRRAASANSSTQTIKQSSNQAILYTPSLKGRYKHYFDSITELTVRLPEGLWRMAPSLWRSVGVSSAVKRDGVELFHGLSHELPYGLPKGVKKVVTMHDLIVFRFPEFFKPADRIIHRLKMRHACRVADIVVAISEQTKRDLMEFLEVPEEKIRVVYQSCDPIFWKPLSQTVLDRVREKYMLPEHYVICVGTLEERKNQLTVVEAMRQLPFETGLVLVGRPRGDYGQKVLDRTNGRIRMLGWASFADFPALYAGAVASVYLSRFEGFGIPVLESLCSDCPVVTSNVSSMPEAGGEAALYASPDDADTVANYLNRLLNDSAFRQECIAKGRIQKMLFSPEKIANDLQRLYEALN